MPEKKIVIAGAAAGGAAAAAKARRMDEHASIVMFEKGSYISYTNCGLPYYISGEIPQSGDLILQTPECLRRRFNVDVNLNHEVTAINRDRKTITVDKQCTTRCCPSFEVPYDKLILAPGSLTIKPRIHGIDARNVFELRTVPDVTKVFRFIDRNLPRTAVVIGGGYVGLEAADSLQKRRIKVTVVEMEQEVMPLLDQEMAGFVHRHLNETGVEIISGRQVLSLGVDREGFARQADVGSSETIPGDMFISTPRVIPDVEMARAAGLKIGITGAIKVNSHMQTSDPDIYAVGDTVESRSLVTGKPIWIHLAGPAYKQGRVAGANAAGGNYSFHGVLGTRIFRVGSLTVAKTGLSAREATSANIPHFVVTTQSHSHADYFPGWEVIHVKMVAERNTGRVIGAQVIGKDGVDKRIDVFATAIQLKADVEDLANLDLSYAPPYNSAKDPVNVSGMTGQNRMMGVERYVELEEYRHHRERYNLLDVRSVVEHSTGSFEESWFLPLDEIREKLDQIPSGKPLITYCRGGYHGYVAQRLLSQRGIEAYNLDGGFFKIESRHPQHFIQIR